MGHFQNLGWTYYHTVVLIPEERLKKSLEIVRNHVPVLPIWSRVRGLYFEPIDIHMQMHPSENFLMLDDAAKDASLQAFCRFAAWKGILI